MPDVGLGQILDTLGQRLTAEQAEELLALALDDLDLPVRPAYTPAEVLAIGAAIAEAQRQALATSDIPQVRELEALIAPFLDGVKSDAPHKPSAEA